MSKNKIQFQKGLSLSDFLEEYGTEDQCFESLVKLRWPEGFECPKCSCRAYCLLTKRKLFQCNACRRQTSITAETIYHSTKIPLTKWFLATYLMTQSKSGISQLELGRQLGVSSNTGAMVYHKLAQVMLERDAQKPLSGNVEIDDAYWGGKKKGGKRGRGSENKTPFLAAVEKNADNHPIHIKLSVVFGFKKKEIKRWAEKHFALGTTAVSDGLRCFTGIKEAGFEHTAITVGNSRDMKKTIPFNWVNTILGNLKSALSGIYHKLSSNHLPRHLATFQYRFNRRFVLGDMIKRLVFVSLRTLPMPRRILKLADYHW